MSPQHRPTQPSKGLLMSADGLTVQPLREHSIPARRPFDTDEAGELSGPVADGFELFAQAVATVPRASVGHAQLVLAIGTHHHKVCRCGWVSLAHLSAWSAEREGCPLHAAELERALRAKRSGPVVIAALRNLACAGVPLRHVPDGAVSDSHRHETGKAKG